MASLLIRVFATLILFVHIGPPAIGQAQQVVVIDQSEEVAEDDVGEVFADAPILPATPLAAETVDDVLLTVVDVSRPCADPWAKPPDRHVWVCLLVTLHNLSDETREYGPEQFSVVTSEAKLVRPTSHQELGDGLQSGLLAPGGALAGSLRFEMAEIDNARVLRFASARGFGAESRDIPL
jgi:Domain of unknown function (DUF4352)